MRSKLEIITDMKEGLEALTGEQLETPVLDSSVNSLGLALLQVFVDIRDVLNEILIELQGRPR